jgi:Cytochrome c554 and c-prime
MKQGTTGSMARENPEATDPRPPGSAVSSRAARTIVALSLAVVVAAGIWGVLGGPKVRQPRAVRLLTIDRPFPEGGRFESDPYIGSKVCAECHPGEAALQSRCGHALTLRRAGRLPVARQLDGTRVADPQYAAIDWSYRLHDRELYIARRSGNQVEECIAEYAFGSGHHATTFVSVIDPKTPVILEHRLTYYAKESALGITPGQIVNPPPPGLTAHGFVCDPETSRRCFHCHATVISARDGPEIDEETLIPNVTCERCHGPARAHVAAARRGAADPELVLPFGTDQWTADSLMTLCGACHRHPSEAGDFVISPEAVHLIRFQPIGIMQSKCYTASGGALSCVTCHDPHARSSADRPSYDAVCLSCHASRAGLSDAAGPIPKPSDRPLGASRSCPVSPSSRCVECHMPRLNAGQSILYSDHWIRVHQPGESPAGPVAPLLAPARQGPDPPKP